MHAHSRDGDGAGWHHGELRSGVTVFLEDDAGLHSAETGTSADSAPPGGPAWEAPRESRGPGTAVRFGFLKAGSAGGE